MLELQLARAKRQTYITSLSDGTCNSLKTEKVMMMKAAPKHEREPHTMVVVSIANVCSRVNCLAEQVVTLTSETL